MIAAMLVIKAAVRIKVGLGLAVGLVRFSIRIYFTV